MIAEERIDPYAGFTPILEYPPAGELRDSLADIADLTVVTERDDGRVVVDMLREAGDEEYRVRFDIHSREVAWESLSRIRLQSRAIFAGQEQALGITYIPKWRR